MALRMSALLRCGRAAALRAARPAPPLQQPASQRCVTRHATNEIAAALETTDVVVTDQGGDGRHVSIDVVAAAFDGKSAVDRQRMVYKAIWQELSGVVHAVDAMTTRTPAEAQQS